MKQVGHDEAWDRDLFVLDAASPDDLPISFSLPSPRFVCLIAWDATGATAAVIASLARRLLDAGAVYLCAWGPDSQRIHDTIDEEAVGPNPLAEVDRVVMTTWHSDESLAEVLQFVLTSTWPDEPYTEGCGATLGIAIGSPQWASEIRQAFSKPKEFIERQLANG